MALGVYFGRAGSVRSLYRCYIGRASTVRTVSAIYIGRGGSVRKVWPSGLIYDAGTIYEPLTFTPYTTSSGVECTTISYGSSAMTITNGTTSAAEGAFHSTYLSTTDTIDLSAYSTLSMTYQITAYNYTSNDCYLYLGPSTSPTTIPSTSNRVTVSANSVTGNASTLGVSNTATLDISDVTSSGYVVLAFRPYGYNTFTVQITHIELS